MIRVTQAATAACLLLAGPSAAAAQAPGDDAFAQTENGAMVFKNYPKKSLARGEEGIVSFQVKLNKDGKLGNCIVTESSGFPDLDAATCELIVMHARFKAVENEAGWRIASSHAGKVLWKLPEGLARAERPQPQALARKVDLAETELICKRAARNDSFYVQKKVCLSRKDWDRTRLEGRQALQEAQSPKGPMQPY